MKSAVTWLLFPVATIVDADVVPVVSAAVLGTDGFLLRCLISLAAASNAMTRSREWTQQYAAIAKSMPLRLSLSP